MSFLYLAIGGIIPIWVVAWLIGLGLKKLDATKIIIYSSIASYIFVVIVSSFGNGSWNPFIVVGYSDYPLPQYAISLGFVIAIRLGLNSRRS